MDTFMYDVKADGVILETFLDEFGAKRFLEDLIIRVDIGKKNGKTFIQFPSKNLSYINILTAKTLRIVPYKVP